MTSTLARRSLRKLSVSLLLITVGCGGDDAAAPAPQPSSLPTPAPSSTPTPPPTPSETPLVDSAPVIASQDNQIIRNLRIVAKGNVAGISVVGHSNVTIENVLIYHEGAAGIDASDADNLRIVNVKIVNTAAPAKGAHTGDRASDRNNVRIYRSNNVSIDKAYLEKGSSGIYVVESTNPRLTDIEGHDFRGPFPRGQLVQFDKCVSPVLDGFSVFNPGATAWTEDVVNAYGSRDPVVRNGYIEGINSPSGIGVIVENGDGGSGGLIENVDVRYWVNGAFMAATRASGVVFRNVRAFDGIAPAAVAASAGKPGADGQPVPTLEQWAGTNFRGPPSSGQEPFLVYETKGADTIFENAAYSNLAREGRIAWDLGRMAKAEFAPTTAQPRQALRLTFPWD